MSRAKWWGWRVGGVFFCYLVFCGVFFITHATGGIMRPLSSLVIIPAACVKGELLMYKELAELTQGLKGFGGFEKHKQAFDQALLVSVQRLYIQDLADELNVAVAREDIEAYALDQDVIGPTLEAVKWNEDDYRKFVVEPLLLAQVTEEALSLSKDYQAPAADQMESLRKKLAQGMPFSDVAANFSEDPSALSRGDLGIMSLDTLPVWLEPALELEVGDISQVLEAPVALWTVTLIEFYPSNIDTDSAAVHFRGIAVKKKSLGAVLGDKMSDNPAWVNVW